jgi:hypothetical protein
MILQTCDPLAQEALQSFPVFYFRLEWAKAKWLFLVRCLGIPEIYTEICLNKCYPMIPARLMAIAMGIRFLYLYQALVQLKRNKG